jgi:hypothetical protein
VAQEDAFDDSLDDALFSALRRVVASNWRQRSSSGPTRLCRGRADSCRLRSAGTADVTLIYYHYNGLGSVVATGKWAWQNKGCIALNVVLTVAQPKISCGAELGDLRSPAVELAAAVGLPGCDHPLDPLIENGERHLRFLRRSVDHPGLLFEKSAAL